MTTPHTSSSQWLDLSFIPIALALLAVSLGGIFLLDRADQQARDTIRKHHLLDIEKALYYARVQKDTYPPSNFSAWCGSLAVDSAARQEIEMALRQQNDKYANPAKPFPTDPLQNPGYFYRKIGQHTFELYAMLENDVAGAFATNGCDDQENITYTYGINSSLRNNQLEYSL